MGWWVDSLSHLFNATIKVDDELSYLSGHQTVTTTTDKNWCNYHPAKKLLKHETVISPERQ